MLRKCRKRHSCDIDREITTLIVRPYKYLQDLAVDDILILCDLRVQALSHREVTMISLSRRVISSRPAARCAGE